MAFSEQETFRSSVLLAAQCFQGYTNNKALKMQEECPQVSPHLANEVGSVFQSKVGSRPVDSVVVVHSLPRKACGKKFLRLLFM